MLFMNSTTDVIVTYARYLVNQALRGPCWWIYRSRPREAGEPDGGEAEYAGVPSYTTECGQAAVDDYRGAMDKAGHIGEEQ